MPNYVTNKILFSQEHEQRVLTLCCPYGEFLFNSLIPQPLHMFHGDLSSENEQDFPLNWLDWNVKNWGTKWNACNTHIGHDDDRVFIQFDTAWSSPYPVICAFVNRFQISIEHRYFDEGHCFWGIEKWGEQRGHYTRTVKLYNLPEKFKPLCLELKDYDPEEDSAA